MKETDLPAKQQMPEALRDRIWSDIEPRLEPPASRFRPMRAPLAVAASVIVVALAVVFGLPLVKGPVIQVATGPDAQLIEECLLNGHNVRDSGVWRAGARIDGADESFMVIRTDTAAAICDIENGKGTGLLGGEPFEERYGRLTAARPFDYLTSMNYLNGESIHFGITASDVTALSLVAPNDSKAPGVVRDGTFAVRTRIAEQSDEPTTNYVQATLTGGRTVTGPLRPN